MPDDLAVLREAASDLLSLLERPKAKRTYYMEDIEQKRLVLGSGGKSGNCDYCVDAEERGWIEQDEVYDSPFGDQDGPPLHPNCDCELEYRTGRKRVYV